MFPPLELIFIVKQETPDVLFFRLFVPVSSLAGQLSTHWNDQRALAAKVRNPPL